MLYYGHRGILYVMVIIWNSQNDAFIIICLLDKNTTMSSVQTCPSNSFLLLHPLFALDK